MHESPIGAGTPDDVHESPPACERPRLWPSSWASTGTLNEPLIQTCVPPTSAMPDQPQQTERPGTRRRCACTATGRCEGSAPMAFLRPPAAQSSRRLRQSPLVGGPPGVARARGQPSGTRSRRRSARGSRPSATSGRCSWWRRRPLGGQLVGRLVGEVERARPRSSPSRAARSSPRGVGRGRELRHRRDGVREHERAVLHRALEPDAGAGVDPDVVRRPHRRVPQAADEHRLAGRAPSRPSACRITNCPLRCTSAGPVPGSAPASGGSAEQREARSRGRERRSHLGDRHACSNSARKRPWRYPNVRGLCGRPDSVLYRTRASAASCGRAGRAARASRAASRSGPG